MHANHSLQLHVCVTAVGTAMASSSERTKQVKCHLIQAFMDRKVMKKRDCVHLYKQIYQFHNVSPPEMSLMDTIVNINTTLKPLGMKIQSGKAEHDGSEWIGIVNTLKDEVVKKSTQLGLAQLEFFKNILSIIVENDGSVTSNSAINVCDSMERKLTKKSAQDLLKQFKHSHWLIEVNGEFMLGPRSVLELLPFLDEVTGQPINECVLCSSRVVKGQRCDNCQHKLHLHCIKRLLTGSSRSIKCPSCNFQWTED